MSGIKGSINPDFESSTGALDSGRKSLWAQMMFVEALDRVVPRARKELLDSVREILDVNFEEVPTILISFLWPTSPEQIEHLKHDTFDERPKWLQDWKNIMKSVELWLNKYHLDCYHWMRECAMVTIAIYIETNGKYGTWASARDGWRVNTIQPLPVYDAANIPIVLSVDLTKETETEARKRLERQVQRAAKPYIDEIIEKAIKQGTKVVSSRERDIPLPIRFECTVQRIVLNKSYKEITSECSKKIQLDDDISERAIESAVDIIRASL